MTVGTFGDSVAYDAAGDAEEEVASRAWNRGRALMGEE